MTIKTPPTAGAGVFLIVTRAEEGTKGAVRKIDLSQHSPSDYAQKFAESLGQTLIDIQLLALSDRAVASMTAAGDASIAELLAMDEEGERGDVDTTPLIGSRYCVATETVTLPNGWIVGREVAAPGDTRKIALHDAWNRLREMNWAEGRMFGHDNDHLAEIWEEVEDHPPEDAIAHYLAGKAVAAWAVGRRCILVLHRPDRVEWFTNPMFEPCDQGEFGDEIAIHLAGAGALGRFLDCDHDFNLETMGTAIEAPCYETLQKMIRSDLHKARAIGICLETAGWAMWESQFVYRMNSLSAKTDQLWPAIKIVADAIQAAEAEPIDVSELLGTAPKRDMSGKLITAGTAAAAA